MPPDAHLHFDHGLEAPRHARRFVVSHLEGTPLEPLRTDAELLASEVVANVIRHTDHGGDLTLTLAPDRLRVSVVDTDGRHEPQVQHPTPNEECGRGMAIVSAAADRWGVSHPDPHHKCVWFELTAPTRAGTSDRAGASTTSSNGSRSSRLGGSSTAPRGHAGG